MECRVCSAEADGFHYKIVTCRACAAFFRRTIHLKLQYKCKLKRNCQVYHDTLLCRYCRMKKCLVVGMLTDGTEPLLDYYVNGTYSGRDLESDEREILTSAACWDNHEEFSAHVKIIISKILRKGYRSPNLPFKLSLCQQSAQAYENLEAKYEQVPPTKAKEKYLAYSAEDMKQFINDLFVVLINLAEFLMEIEPFANLPYRDKVMLYKNKMQVFFDVSFSARTVKYLGRDLNETKMIMFDGHIMDFRNTKFDVSPISNMTEEGMRELMSDTHSKVDNLILKPFKRVNPDDFEVQYLLQKSLWYLEGDEISKETLLQAEHIQAELDDELTHYYKHALKLENVASRIYKIHNLLSGIEKVSKIRERDQQLWKTFDIYKFDLWIDDIP